VAAINALNKQHDALVDDPEIATRIAQYEMAFQMQASVPDLMDMSKLKARKRSNSTAAAGRWLVRVELPARASSRRARHALHPALSQGLGPSRRREELWSCKAKEIDRACMALITDLKQRGMLDDTLIVWAGEFGRTPMSQGGSGRDHHNKAMSVWLAGAGIQGGIVHGATDDLGYAAHRKDHHRARSARDDAPSARHPARRLQLQVPGP
jgi:hypothetical protein